VVAEAKQVFWAEGTHYYAPLQTTDLVDDRDSFVRLVQDPFGDGSLRLVGEAYSEHNQGWSEGALQSAVER